MSDLPTGDLAPADHVTVGPGAVDQLPALVAERGARHVLLVCGRRSFEASGAARVLPALQRTARVTRFDDFAPNTDAADLARGLALAADDPPDLVLGVGGGSAMDTAKLLAAWLGRTTLEEVHAAIRSGARIESREAALVLVPTTAGSGSEATHFAVVYIAHDKHSIAGPAMLPDAVVLDPDLPRSGSAHQRATSGIDAVCQATESLWAVGGTADSRRFARAALALLLEHLEGFVTDAASDHAVAVTHGAHLAGRAIDVSKTTAPHAMSYGLTKRHGIPHGHAVALTLGPWLEQHAEATVDQLRPKVDPGVHAAAVTDVLTAFGATDGRQARDRFTALLRGIGLEPSLTALGVADDEERQVLAAAVNTERLGNDPLAATTEDLVATLRAAG